MLHDKAYCCAMHTTTEAMVKLLGLTDGKRGRFFVMKRAASNVICTGFFKGHIALNDVHDVETIKQILNETFWNHASSAFSSKPTDGQNQAFRPARTSAIGLSTDEAGTSLSRPDNYFDSCAFIRTETRLISARPANLGLSKPITLPISCGPTAPTAAIASTTAAMTSASPSCCGI